MDLPPPSREGYLFVGGRAAGKEHEVEISLTGNENAREKHLELELIGYYVFVTHKSLYKINKIFKVR